MYFNYSSASSIGSAVRLQSSTGPGTGECYEHREIRSLGALQPNQRVKNCLNRVESKDLLNK